MLPQLWYRNTWRWESDEAAPTITKVKGATAHTTHPNLGDRCFNASSSIGNEPALLFCENETNNERLFRVANQAAKVKDGIDDYVIHGNGDAVDSRNGSKVAAHVQADLTPGESLTVTVRFAPADLQLPFDDVEQTMEARKAEADEFYSALATTKLTADERLVQRQALAGLLWCKQYYHYEVRRWLEGDPGQPAPPTSLWTGRNCDWQHLVNRDVVLMPDAWEYPWNPAHVQAVHRSRRWRGDH